MKCQNCTFINNKVLVKRDNESEFAGALYLVMGEIINCTFNENSAFNEFDLIPFQTAPSIMIYSKIRVTSNRWFIFMLILMERPSNYIHK